MALLNLQQEGTGQHLLYAAVTSPLAAGGEQKLVLCAGNAHVEEAALLLQTLVLLVLPGKDTVFQSRQDDPGELQPLGVVDGDEGNGVGCAAVAVGLQIAVQLDVVQKVQQAGHGHGVEDGAVCQLLQVGHPLCSRHLILGCVIFHKPAELVQLLHKVGQLLFWGLPSWWRLVLLRLAVRGILGTCGSLCGEIRLVRSSPFFLSNLRQKVLL